MTSTSQARPSGASHTQHCPVCRFSVRGKKNPTQVLLELAEHCVAAHPDDQGLLEQAREVMILVFTKHYGLSEVVTPAGIWNRNGFQAAIGRPPQAAHFKGAAHFELTGPKRLSWKTNDPNFRSMYPAAFCHAMGLTVHRVGRSGAHITHAVTDHTELNLDDRYGRVCTGNPGKIFKRGQDVATCDVAVFDPRPSPEGLLHVNGLTLTWRADNTLHNTGDGQGKIRRSVLESILTRDGLGDIINDVYRVQPHIAGETFIIKGHLIVIDDDRWTEDVDLVFDQAGIARENTYQRVTLGKINVYTKKQQIGVRPLNWKQTASALTRNHVAPEELAQQAIHLADRLDTLHAGMAIERQDAQQLSELLGTSHLVRYHGFKDDEALRRRLGDAKRDQFNQNIWEASGRQLWVTPSIVRRATGGALESLLGGVKRSPGIIASGFAAYVVHHQYAQVNEPTPGFIHLEWDDTDPSILLGITFNQEDFHRLLNPLDGADMDDLIEVIPLKDDQGYASFVYRNPLSWGGGAILRLREQDAARLFLHGYHFYRRTGEAEWPDLYDEEKYPTQLTAQDFEPPMQWPNTPWEQEQLALRLAANNWVIGAAANVNGFIGASDWYQPDAIKHLFSDVVDMAVTGDRDASPILEALDAYAVEQIHQGRRANVPMLREAGAMSYSLKEKYRETHLPAMKTELPWQQWYALITAGEFPHYQVMKDGMAKALLFAAARTRVRELMAIGPAEALLRPLSPEVTLLGEAAEEQRRAIWARRATNKLSSAWAEDKVTEMLLRYYAISAELPGFENGDFAAALTRALTLHPKRFDPWNDVPGLNLPKPVYVNHLAALPPQEYLANYLLGKASPGWTTRYLGNLTPGEAYQVTRHTGGHLVAHDSSGSPTAIFNTHDSWPLTLRSVSYVGDIPGNHAKDQPKWTGVAVLQVPENLWL